MIADLEGRLPREPLKLEAERLARVSEGAETRAHFLRESAELGTRLRRLERAVGRGQIAQMATEAGAVARLAAPLGLVSLCAIAADAAGAAARADGAALAATAARLCRQGRRAQEVLDELRRASG